MFDVDIEEARRNDRVHVYTHCQNCGERIRGEKFCTNCGSEAVKFHSTIFLKLENAENELATRKLNEAGLVIRHTTSTGSPIAGGRRFECFIHCNSCKESLGWSNFMDKTMRYCPHCGEKFGLPCYGGVVDVLFTDTELKDYILEVFYERNPQFRPVQEQEYKLYFAVFRKWNDSADFEDEPLTELEMVTSADGANADIATKLLLDDFDQDGALYASLKDHLNEAINGILKRWDKTSEFYENDIFTVYCSLDEEHEFIVDVRITKID